MAFNVVWLTGACTWEDVKETMKPVPFGIDRSWVDNAPAGSDMFREGWRHGCETGLNAYGTHYYKSFYEWKQDPRLVNEPDYYKGWKLAYTYCRLYTAKWITPWDGF